MMRMAHPTFKRGDLVLARGMRARVLKRLSGGDEYEVEGLHVDYEEREKRGMPSRGKYLVHARYLVKVDEPKDEGEKPKSVKIKAGPMTMGSTLKRFGQQ